MSPEQRELARHALGLPTDSGSSYRNRFIAGEGHRDYTNWLAMTAGGWATRETGAHLCFGGADLFELTPEGARLALNPGERLDPEDFPEAHPNTRTGGEGDA